MQDSKKEVKQLIIEHYYRLEQQFISWKFWRV